MARMPASLTSLGVSKSGSPADRSITSSPAARRRWVSWLMEMVSGGFRYSRFLESRYPSEPELAVMGGPLGLGSRLKRHVVGRDELDELGNRQHVGADVAGGGGGRPLGAGGIRQPARGGGGA